MLGAGPQLGPKVTRRLAARLLVMLSVALLPIGAIAVFTTARTVHEAQRGADQALVSLAAEGVAGQRALIESAFATATSLGPPALERRGDPPACRALLAEFVRRSGVFRYAALVAPDGTPLCASDPRGLELAGRPGVRRHLAARQAAVFPEPAADGSGQLVVLQPLAPGEATAGPVEAFVAITLPDRALDLMAQVSGGGDDAPHRTLLLNAWGELLPGARAGSDPAADLPVERDLADLVAGAPRVLQGTTAAGERATFAVATLVPGRLYALGVWPGGAGAAAAGGIPYAPVIFPVLMWLASLGVAYFAVYRLVIRHIRRLNQQMRRFALGHRDTAPEVLEDAPAELREVSATFNKLARILARDEAELAASLREKTVLLKEVHHRVKNNLQLIASILNLQMRQVSDPAARRVLQSVQDRVIGLSTVHRRLYEADRLSAVRADRLIEELTRQLVAVGTDPGAGLRVTTRLEPVTLCPDRMVPLSLLVTEAIINAVKHVGLPPGGAGPWIDIVLARDPDGRVRLSVANALGAAGGKAAVGGGAASGTQLGMQLIEAFAQQLDAALTSGERPAADLRDGEAEDARAWCLTVLFAEEPEPASGSAPQPAAAAPVPSPVGAGD